MNNTERILYTIGHSNHPQQVFFDLLRAHAIEVLVDTRSSPYSKYATQFNVPELKAAAQAAGIDYIYLGRELGGRPANKGFYDSEGFACYDRIAGTELFRLGLLELEAAALYRPTVVCCTEENPTACHRRLLIGRSFHKYGFTLLHIRGDGRVETEADLQQEEQRTYNSKQLAFAYVAEEKITWKSTQSVLRRKLPSNSSKP